MKKHFLWFGLLLIIVSCEDTMEGDIVPRHPDTTSDLGKFSINPYAPYTHYEFVFSTEGKADGSCFIGTNPASGSDIYIEIKNGVAVDAWAEQPAALITRNTAQASAALGFTTPPVHGQPQLVVLGQIAPLPDFCYQWFSHPDPQTQQDRWIMVVQPAWEPGITWAAAAAGSSEAAAVHQSATMALQPCIPSPGEVQVYVPIAL